MPCHAYYAINLYSDSIACFDALAGKEVDQHAEIVEAEIDAVRGDHERQVRIATVSKRRQGKMSRLRGVCIYVCVCMYIYMCVCVHVCVCVPVSLDGVVTFDHATGYLCNGSIAATQPARVRCPISCFLDT